MDSSYVEDLRDHMGQCLCGKEVAPPRTIYCSETCRRRATRKRHSSSISQKRTSSDLPVAKKSDSFPSKKALGKDRPLQSSKKLGIPTTPSLSTTQKQSTKKAVVPPGLPALMPLPLLTLSVSPPSSNKGLLLQRPLGRNMPAKMQLLEAIQRAHQLGYSAVQLFLSDPDTWNAPLLFPTLALAVAQALSEAHFLSIVIHAPFVIDLSSVKESIWINSILLLRATIEQARLIGATDVVVHLNNYKKAFSFVSNEQIERIVKAIIYVFSERPTVPLSSIRLLLENGCNPRFSPGSKIETLGTILHTLPSAYQQHVQVCLDTAHCWVAGYDLCTQMAQFLYLVETSIGLSHIQLLHLNDAKHTLGSTKDEHAQWGTGQLSTRGISGIQMLLQDPRLAHVALILETPLLKKENGQPDWEQEKQHQMLVTRLFLAWP